MTVPATGQAQSATAARPERSAERMLSGLLALIRNSERVEDFTPERLQQYLQVDVVKASDGSGGYGFGAIVTPQWRQGFEAMLANKSGVRFRFGFDERAAGSSPPMTALCAIDFDRFTAELEAMGFKRRRFGGSPGIPRQDSFERPGMGVGVQARDEMEKTPADAIGHLCVKTVTIR